MAQQSLGPSSLAEQPIHSKKRGGRPLLLFSFSFSFSFFFSVFFCPFFSLSFFPIFVSPSVYFSLASSIYHFLLSTSLVMCVLSACFRIFSGAQSSTESRQPCGPLIRNMLLTSDIARRYTSTQMKTNECNFTDNGSSCKLH